MRALAEEEQQDAVTFVAHEMAGPLQLLSLQRLRERFKLETKESLVVAKATRFLVDNALLELLARE